MTSRFEMAEELVAWARRRLAEFGPHQQDSFRAGSATASLRIAIKEILEHLRSALDYCARELCERSPDESAPPPRPVYFPIVAKGFDPGDFRSRVGKTLPGLLDDRADLLPVLESFQAFASDRNRWLPDLATLCNENKHERLSVQSKASSVVHVRGIAEGWRIAAMRPCDTPRLGGPSCLGFVPTDDGPGTVTDYEMVYFVFDAIGEEVETFLRNAVDGTERVVRTLGERR